jgi:hypothetical protein
MDAGGMDWQRVCAVHHKICLSPPLLVADPAVSLCRDAPTGHSNRPSALVIWHGKAARYTASVAEALRHMGQVPRRELHGAVAPYAKVSEPQC